LTKGVDVNLPQAGGNRCHPFKYAAENGDLFTLCTYHSFSLAVTNKHLVYGGHGEENTEWNRKKRKNNKKAYVILIQKDYTCTPTTKLWRYL
jgi:hypothetical protein